MTKDASTMPPLDTSGEIDDARNILRRFRKTLDKLTPEWRDWVIDSLAAGYETDEEVSE